MARSTTRARKRGSGIRSEEDASAPSTGWLCARGVRRSRSCTWQRTRETYSIYATIRTVSISGILWNPTSGNMLRRACAGGYECCLRVEYIIFFCFYRQSIIMRRDHTSWMDFTRAIRTDESLPSIVGYSKRCHKNAYLRRNRSA